MLRNSSHIAGVPQMHDACILIDAQGKIIFASQQWQTCVKIFDCASHELVGANFFDLLTSSVCTGTEFYLDDSKQKQANDKIIAYIKHALVIKKSGILAILRSDDPKVPIESMLCMEAVGQAECSALIYHRCRESRQYVSSGLEFDNRFYDTLFETLEDGVIYQNLEGKIEIANRAAENLLDFSFERDVHACLFSSQWKYLDRHARLLDDSVNPFLEALRTLKSHAYKGLGIEKSNGQIIWVNLSCDVILNPHIGVPHGILVSLTDITCETHTKQELETVSERLKLALDGADIGIWDWLIAKDRLIWDDQMYQHFGVERGVDQSANKFWVSSAHPDDLARVQEETQHIVQTKKDGFIELRVLLENKQMRYLRTYARPVVGEDGHVERVVGMLWDITKEKESEKRIEEIVYIDDLTSLPNRMAFNKKINKLIDDQIYEPCTIALLVVDLDHFRDINDNFGHLVGDSLVKEVTELIRGVLTKNEYLARIGGDEFAIMVPGIKSKEEAAQLGEKIQSLFREPIYLLGGQVINVRISIGVSMYPVDGEDAISIIKAADLSIHHAKGNGRNSVVTYKEEYSNELTTKLYLESELRSAIRDEELILYYQPIINLKTKEIVGCEALLRWIDKNGKFVSPMSFIPVAEDSGLIYPLSHWINSTVFKQLKLWQSLNVKMQYVSINVSPHQLQHANFIHDLKELLHTYDVSPQEIQLEITEGTFLQESVNSSSHLKELNRMGFRLAIDDFGTGYSSLAYLKRFDVDVIKIDRSFVKDLEDDPADRDIVKAIIAMTKSLGFETLVEGVETKEQSLIVSALGCGYGQGYLYGRPTFADEFAELYIGVKNSPVRAIKSKR